MLILLLSKFLSALTVFWINFFFCPSAALFHLTYMIVIPNVYPFSVGYTVYCGCLGCSVLTSFDVIF